MKQVAINLYDSVCGTLHANPGVHSEYNIISSPQRFRQTAFLITKEVSDLRTAPRFVIGRTNHAESGETSNYHVNPHFGCITAVQRDNRIPLIVELRHK